MNVIQGDCFKELPKFPDGYFDYCLTSPPFKDEEFGSDYWNSFDGLLALLREKVSKVAFVFNSSTKIREMFSRYPEIKRLLIWGKQPSCYSYRYEPIFVFQFDEGFKVNKYLFKDFWAMPPVLGNSSSYENPIKLYREILLKLPKGRVLDCFAGTGTTGLACKQLGLDFVLIERNKEKVELINSRLKQTLLKAVEA